MIRKNTILTVALLVGALSLATMSSVLNLAIVKAQKDETFTATPSGKDEIPPTKSNANGTSKFQVNSDSSRVSYWFTIIGLKKVNQAQIYNGRTGQNGDPVVTLTNGKSAKGSDTPSSIKLSGNITRDDLQGSLKGKEISDLIGLMSNGSTYVNVHTDKYQKGAIRGQISSGDVDMQKMWVPENTSGSSSQK